MGWGAYEPFGNARGLRLLGVQGRAVSPYPVQDSGRQLLNAERDIAATADLSAGAGDQW